ncbi:MAG: DUF302 domain-containing protein [Gemmatimonadales bacterium]
MLTLLAALVFAPVPADTLLRTQSSLGVAQTVVRLRTAAESRGLTIFAVVDHAANARAVDLPLAASTLVLLGNPRAGTLLMQCDPSVAADLPLRMLVWEDAEGRTWVGHHDARALATRYDLAACQETVDRIVGVLEALRREAAGAGGE